MSVHSRELDRRVLVILRHKAPLHGLVVRHDGYIEVEALCRLNLKYTAEFWEPERQLDLGYLQDFAARRPDLLNLLHERTLSSETGRKWYIRARSDHSLSNINTQLQEIPHAAFVPLAVYSTTRTKWKRIMCRGAVIRRKGTAYIHFRAHGMTLNDEKDEGAVVLILNMTAAMSSGLKFYHGPDGEIVTQGNEHGVVPMQFLSLSPQSAAEMSKTTCAPRLAPNAQHAPAVPENEYVRNQFDTLARERRRLVKIFYDNKARLQALQGLGEQTADKTDAQHDFEDLPSHALDPPKAMEEDDIVIISGTPKPPEKWMIIPVGIPGCGKTGVSAAIAHIFQCAHVQIGDMEGPRANKDFLAKVAEVLKTATVVIADRNNHMVKHRQALRDIAAAHTDKTGAVVKVITLRWQLHTPSLRAVHAACYRRIMSWRSGHQWFIATPGESLESVLWKFLYEAEPLQPQELDHAIDVDPLEGLGNTLERVVPELARMLIRERTTTLKHAIDVAHSYHPKTRPPVPKSTPPPKGREKAKPSTQGASDAEDDAAHDDPPPADNGAAQHPSGKRIPRPRKGPAMDLRAARTLSKRLAAVLRHRAKEAGLKMRGDGYARMNDLLALPTFRKQTFEAIRTVVEMSDVQRFMLIQETDAATGKTSWWIRANQGHTMESVTVEMEELRDASLVPMAVHATTRKAWKSIWTYGISRMARQHIHLHPGLEKPGMRRNDPILIFVDVRKAMDAGIKFLVSSNNVVLTAGDADGFLRPEFFLRVERSGRPIAGFDGPRTAAT